ncbi:uncharacterized protein LOC135197242 [Macrobrachium nipponense]|uniref:uncharacterized protein LOC135197242 n=1 Tax=Macrobrachium nipponense TaxID=159736 RepID=UPI0030C7BC79
MSFALVKEKYIMSENVSAAETEKCFIFAARDMNKIIPKNILELVTYTQDGLDLVFTENSVVPLNDSQPYSLGSFSISTYSPEYYTVCTLLTERELLGAFSAIKEKQIVDESPPDYRNCFIFTEGDLRQILQQSILDKVAAMPRGLDFIFTESSVEPLINSQQHSQPDFSVHFHSAGHYVVCTLLTHRELLTAFSSVNRKQNPDRYVLTTHPQYLPEARKCFIFAARDLWHIIPQTVLDMAASSPNGVDLIFTENSVEPLTYLQSYSKPDFSLYFSPVHSYTVCTLLTPRQLLMAFTSIKDRQNVDGHTSEHYGAKQQDARNCLYFRASDMQQIIPEAILNTVTPAPNEVHLVFSENSVEPLLPYPNLYSDGDFSVSVYSADYYKVCTRLNEGELLFAFGSIKFGRNKGENVISSSHKDVPPKDENCFVFAGKDMRQIVPVTILEKVDSTSSRIGLVFTEDSVEPLSHLVSPSRADFSVASHSGDYYSICTLLTGRDILMVFSRIKGGKNNTLHTPQLSGIPEENGVRKCNTSFDNSKNLCPDEKQLNCHDTKTSPCNLHSGAKEATLNIYVYPIVLTPKTPDGYPSLWGTIYQYKERDPDKSLGINDQKSTCCEGEGLLMYSGPENDKNNQFWKGNIRPPFGPFAYPWARPSWLSTPANNKGFGNGPFLFSMNAQPRDVREIGVGNSSNDIPQDLNGHGDEDLQFANENNEGNKYYSDEISDESRSSENFTLDTNGHFAHESYESFENEGSRTMDSAGMSVEPVPENESMLNSDYDSQQSLGVAQVGTTGSKYVLDDDIHHHSGNITMENEDLQVTVEYEDISKEKPVTSNQLLRFLEDSADSVNRPNAPADSNGNRVMQPEITSNIENQVIQTEKELRTITPKRGSTSSDERKLAFDSSDLETSQIETRSVSCSTIGCPTTLDDEKVGSESLDYGWYESDRSLDPEDNSPDVGALQPDPVDLPYSETSPELSGAYRNVIQNPNTIT